jgi:hypothetical protein
MPVTKRFYENRVIERVKIPRMKEICPNEKMYFRDGTVFMLYKVLNDTYPDIVEITEDFRDIYKRPMIKCYVANRDTEAIIDNMILSNVGKRENIAELMRELSKLDKIDNSKIDEIFDKYKSILGPVCQLYRFCYYWVALCVSLDIRIFENKPTVIHRSLAVRDGIAYARGEMTKEEYGKSWSEIIDRVGPTETITDMKCIHVEGYEKDLTSDVFTHKKGQTVPVRPHERIVITKE